MSGGQPSFIKEQVPLSSYSTFAIGGPARYLATVNNVAELAAALSFAKENNLPYIIIGRGSNSLFDDAGYNGLVIINKISFLTEEDNGIYHVGAGFSFARLGLLCSRRARGGLEFAGGIPGSVGGAIVMNAGANGRETADALVSVEYLDEKGEQCTVTRDKLSFGYRQSPFQKGFRGAIVAARFATTPSEEAQQLQQDIIKKRTASQPYNIPSVGCVFRNPTGTSAGKLIDELGLKGMEIGGARISPVHANFIVNVGGATSDDVKRLITLIRQRIAASHGIELHTEVCYITAESCEAPEGDSHG